MERQGGVGEGRRVWYHRNPGREFQKDRSDPEGLMLQEIELKLSRWTVSQGFGKRSREVFDDLEGNYWSSQISVS